jgi:hypothetical protein
MVVAVLTSEQGGIYPKIFANQSEVKIPERFDSSHLVCISRVFHKLKLLLNRAKTLLKMSFAKKLFEMPYLSGLQPLRLRSAF